MNVSTATPAEIDARIADLNVELYVAKGEQVNEAAQAELMSLYAEYTRRGGWTRFYRVEGSNGHVHTSTACSTTYVTTQFGWLIEQSGATIAEVVELAGGMACLVCFGVHRDQIIEGRPCKLETAKQRKTREEQEAASVMLAAKKATKASKAITDVDGSPLRDGSDFIVNSEVTAQRYYIEAAVDTIVWNTTNRGWTPVGETPEQLQARCDSFTKEYAAVAERLLRALAAKRHGVTEGQELADAIEIERAAMAKKVDAKVRKYNKDSQQIIIG